LESTDLRQLANLDIRTRDSDLGDFQNLVAISSCKDTSVIKYFHDDPIGFPEV